VRTWVSGTGEGDWTSMAVMSDGSYGIQEGLVFSYPVTCKGGDYQIVQGLDIDAFSRARLNATEAELHEERDGVRTLLNLPAS
jgi:malate dehydrogenase